MSDGAQKTIIRLPAQDPQHRVRPHIALVEEDSAYEVVGSIRLPGIPKCSSSHQSAGAARSLNSCCAR